jgi:hypothetical protein
LRSDKLSKPIKILRKPAAAASSMVSSRKIASTVVIVPSAAEQGLTQLRMKIFLGTPEVLVAEPTVKVAGTGTVQFGDASIGIYTLSLALRVSDGASKAPPADLVVPVFTRK